MSYQYPVNFLKYIGTSGGRLSMIKQQRSTGGLWLRYGGINAVIDPGPGALVRITQTQPFLDPESIDAVILTHKHIDHSNDANIMIECMTHGGFAKRGTICAPNDALFGEGAVILPYYLMRPEKIITVRENENAQIGNVALTPVTLIHHGVETFGYIFSAPNLPTWGIISDTKYLPYLAEKFSCCDFVSINVTFHTRKNRLEHLSVEELKTLLESLHPKKVIISHLGRILTADPETLMCGLSTPTTEVVPATDNMVIDLETLNIDKQPITN